jgi:phage-related protein (TIGR01555 family)
MKWFASKKKQRLLELERELAIEKTKTERAAKRLEQSTAYGRVLEKMLEDDKSSHQLNMIEPPKIHPAVVPQGKKAPVAMDSDCNGVYGYVNADPQFYSGFLGYPTLAVMSQSSDYRSVPETTAKEMTREWGEVKARSSGKINDGEDKTDQIAKITAEMERFKIRDLMRKHIENEMIFGRSQLFIDIKGHEDDTDLPLVISSAGIKKDSLAGFSLVESIWSTPSMYNAHNPMAEDFFKPSKWFVLGKEVHADRLMTLIMRPVSDILKPAYNFSGISMLQLMKPYVERWQRTTDAISELIHSFSLTGLATNMQGILNGEDGADIKMRAAMFSLYRDNRNLMLLDKSQEEFFQFNTPLSGLDALQRQAQEQMAAPSHTPLVKLLGITPSGLNASSDGEIRVYNDYIASLQSAHLLPQVTIILKLVQLHLFGEIDDSLYFEFNSLHQLTDEQRASTEKFKAETVQIYHQSGVIDGEEARQYVASDEDNPLRFIDPKKIIPSPYGVPDYGNEENDAEADKART